VIAGAGIAVGWYAFSMFMPASTSKRQDLIEKEERREESVKTKEMVSQEEIEVGLLWIVHIA
jgi:hypothetical protein